MNATLPDIANLTDDAKRRLLSVLIRDLMGTSKKPLDVSDPLGSMVVYTVPINAKERAREAIRKETPEQRAELARRSATIDNSVGVEEWIRMHSHPSSE